MNSGEDDGGKLFTDSGLFYVKLQEVWKTHDELWKSYLQLA